MMRARWIACAAVLVGLVALLSPVPAAEWLQGRPLGVKTIALVCGHGWRASAVGQYGGVSFAVQCENGRGQQRITGVTGTTYGTRMGVESDAVAADCFFTGDSQTVNESCLQVRLSIR